MQKVARRPLKQAIEEFWKRFGVFGTPKAFRVYKRLGGAGLIAAPVAYGATQVNKAREYLQNVDPDKPDYELAASPTDIKWRYAGPVGYDPEVVKERYQQHLQDLINAPYKEPGEQVVTASAQDFLEKRAALQGMKKEAILSAIRRFFSPTARATQRAQQAMNAARAAGVTGEALNVVGQQALSPGGAGLLGKIFSPGGLLIGGSLIGAGALAEPLAQRLGYKGREMAYPGIAGLPERVRMDELMAEDFAKSVGKELGKATVGLAGDVLSKTMALPGSIAGGLERRNVLSQLREEDDVISRADPEQIDEAYHTMVRFAPTLATDKNAVKTFLRESVLYGTGPNFTTIKQLADAEGSVNRPPMVQIKR